MTEKRKKDRNVPTLRFPEFDDEWQQVRLGDLCDLITKGTTPQNFVESGIRFIKIESFEHNEINSKKCLFIDETTHNKTLKRSILKENDILFAIAGATIGKVNIVKKSILPANTNQALAIIRLRRQENNQFILQVLKSPTMEKYIKESISVGAQPNLNLEQINNFNFHKPSSKEQEKIANFISLINSRIETQKKIIEQLESLIKALKANLLNGKLRFKKDNKELYPNWEQKSIMDISFKKSSNISANTLENESGEYSIYGATGVLKQISFFKEDQPYVSIVKDGAGVGRLLYCEAKTSVLGTLDIIRNIEGIDLKFLYYLLSNIDYSKYVTGSTIPHIYFKDYSAEIINLPNIDEQIKISTFLYSVDMKIEIEKNLLKEYLANKKYILNCLFT